MLLVLDVLKNLLQNKEQKLLLLPVQNPPKGHGIWSLSLLAEQSVKLEFVDTISKAHVGRILKKTK